MEKGGKMWNGKNTKYDIKNTIVELPVEYKRLFANDWRHAVIEGGRYSLKSHTVARYVLLRCRMARLRVACLRQYQKNIGDSSYQLLVDLIQQYGFTDFRYTNDAIINTVTGSNIIFKGLERNVEQTIKSLEGVGLAWVDEAQSITMKSIRILVPTIRVSGSQIVWTLNRNTDLDPVIAYFITDPPRDDVWHLETTYHIAKRHGWLSKEAETEIAYAKAHHPEIYAHDYLGKALSTSDRTILSVSRVLAAMGREADRDGAIEVGVDVARLGNDRTEFVKRQGMTEIDRRTYNKLRTTEVVANLEQFVDYDKSILIKVDDTGVGGGVTDQLLADGYNVMPINFGAAAQDKNRYPNLISEAWFYLQQVIDEISIKSDRDLLTELSSREWTMDKAGRRAVESKEQYKKRGYRSPDLADATILAFYTPKPVVIERSAFVG